MYPHTRFDILDQSFIDPIRFVKEKRPLFMCAMASSKGEEGLVKLDSGFERRYGKLDFNKYGQAQLQASTLIDSKAEILVKRIVAADSTLANITLVAKVKAGAPTQKKSNTGKFIFLLDGVETEYDTVLEGNDALATPVMLDTAEVVYEMLSVSGEGDKGAISREAKLLRAQDAGYEVYPLFTIFDNGRGVSNKRLRITPDYSGSRNINFSRYKLSIIENNTIIEEMVLSINPDIIYLNKTYSLEDIVNNNSLQVKAKMYDDSIKDFIKDVESKAGLENLIEEDILFGINKSGVRIQSIKIDPSSVNLTDVFGINLPNGTDGAFADGVFTADGKAKPEYESQLIDFFSGEYDDSIYDHLLYPIEAIIDANYPLPVKKAIENFVDFREDIMFFGDLGLVYTMEELKYGMYIANKSRNCTYNGTSYDIYHPEMKKQITVTIGYGLSRILPTHFKFGRNRPIAGSINDAILREAIPGTVNFVPKVTPKVNQKEELDDIRCNYANYIDGALILQTQYTSQRDFTQLSFVNNMLAMQEVIRAVRNRAPATRYSFIEGEDLETYKGDVQTVLNGYSDNFKELTFVYIEDETMVQNKIFHAAIKVKYRDYVQAEFFKIYSIN